MCPGEPAHDKFGELWIVNYDRYFIVQNNLGFWEEFEFGFVIVVNKLWSVWPEVRGNNRNTFQIHEIYKNNNILLFTITIYSVECQR